MTREELLRLIARAVRRGLTFASETQALATADTVLRDLKAAGIRILPPESNHKREIKNRSRTQPWWAVWLRVGVDSFEGEAYVPPSRASDNRSPARGARSSVGRARDF